MSELAHGLLLQDQGRLEEAEACFYGVLAREPENDFVLGRLALCQMHQPGKKKTALESVDAAIRLRADEPFYHSLRSLILSDLHRGREALAAVDRALALDPSDSFTLAAKAAAFCSMERWAEGEEWSRRSLAADPDNAMASNLLAHTLRLQGKSELNAAAVARLLEADPEDSFAHVNAGWSALHRGDRRQAETHFREALRLDPESDAAREGLIESFRARSVFYRAYLSYCFFMQRFTGGKQWLIIIGFYLVYQASRRYLEKINPLYAGLLAILWLGLVLWVWLAPGVGNFLILLDRSARLALKPGERNQGIAVGGALIAGLVLGAGGFFSGYAPILLAGIGLIASTVPAALAFDNDSTVGRYVFGGLAGLVYLGTIVSFAVEAVRFPANGLHPVTTSLGGAALLAAIACTWLGNVRSLRRGDES
ncbi:MAG: tetratricopeptide repeat protein [Verrucomicrobiales bacterium]|nr:tetratricopeptide repeat protein [Verrucomicrobiales bacterium]